MVKDIASGEGGGGPLFIANVGTHAYFAANDSNCAVNDDPINELCGKPEPHGYELWKSDGTLPGTVMVKDIRPGGADSTPLGFTALGPVVYFTAVDDQRGRELWTTDGTGGGTQRTADIYAATASACCPPGSAAPRSLTVVQGVLFFSATDGSTGEELWRFEPVAP